eukprot:scaffold4182_cov384-Prasinococcus_capsulatus_cf.AAC.8
MVLKADKEARLKKKSVFTRVQGVKKRGGCVGCGSLLRCVLLVTALPSQTRTEELYRGCALQGNSARRQSDDWQDCKGSANQPGLARSYQRFEGATERRQRPTLPDKRPRPRQLQRQGSGASWIQAGQNCRARLTRRRACGH